ncbi:MAG TPA: hypothetical protein DD671_14540 [Balneolaceae bacterium]|nr:hypothetical protein [Balneola sp.]HBQ60792.1 hypothetical protein [Balneolaceae bacterium]|tara:strand:+ start:74992 stop:75420 length:429 start_codon:yes stop_codon:yes gene_type:complete
MIIKDFVKWVLLLSLISSGILKLVNPTFFLPYFSEMPITSEFSVYFSVLFFSAFQIIIVIVALIPRLSEKAFKLICIVFATLSIWTVYAILVGAEVSNDCLRDMVKDQNFKVLAVKNIGITLSSFYLMFANKVNNNNKTIER